MSLKDYVAAGFFAKPEKRLNPLPLKEINAFERKNTECCHFKGIGQLAT
jgi:hypothetical protein